MTTFLLYYSQQEALHDFNEGRKVADEKVCAEIDREIEATKSSQVSLRITPKKLKYEQTTHTTSENPAIL